jgi:phosphoserine phosphatase
MNREMMPIQSQIRSPRALNSIYHPMKTPTLICLFALLLTSAQAGDPLPSWNDTSSKQAIVAFVEKVTTLGSPDFVPVEQRIATFDNDGTLWAEQPIQFQAFFCADRVKALAPQHPEWTNQEPFASVLKGDLVSAMASGPLAALALITTAGSGVAGAEFDKVVTDWIQTARHPQTGRLYVEMVYQPMVELLAYLRANGFKTFMVTGGTTEFLRPWTQQAYGIPPEQVIGTTLKTSFEFQNGQPVIVRLPQLDFFNNSTNKAIAIESRIGRRPIAAFGNSDGDQQMLEWTAAGSGPRLCLLVHHTDAEREWAYDRITSLGPLDKALDEALARGWTVVSMKDDWKVIYVAASPALSIQHAGNAGVIRFSGKLQAADTIVGPWREVQGATNSYTVLPENGTHYYRAAE